MRPCLLLLLFALPSFTFAQLSKADKREALVRDLLRQDKPYKALNQCNAMLGSTPDPRFHVLRADALNRIGEHGKARTDAKAALQAFPESREALLQLAIAQQGVGSLDSAIMHFERIVRVDTTAEVRFHLLAAYQLAGRCAEAMRNLEAAPSILNGPHAARAHRLKGECAAVQGDSTLARKELDEAIALAPRDPVNYNSRGYFAFARFGHHQEAVADYDRAIKLNPNYSYAFNNRGWSWYRLGNKDKALKDINKAARRKVFNPFVYRNLGVIALEGGDTTKACGQFRKALGYGFTALYGKEVEELMQKHCAGDGPAPVQAPNAPLTPQPTKPPVRSNAP